MTALESFVVERQGDWSRLERLLPRARGGGLRSLSSDELEEMARLHQAAASDLARARRDFPGDRVVAYLNRLVSASYSAIYSSAGISWKDVGRWYSSGFPRLWRATVGYYLLAVMFFFAPAILAY